MSMRQVAQLAGVSTSTVSRVINERPNVAAETVVSVRQAMKRLHFAPTIRRVSASSNGSGIRAATIALIVFADPNTQRAQTFDKLLRGVSAALSKHDISLIFSFVRDASQIPPRVSERRVDGVLLNGGQPAWDIVSRLGNLPVCWLMANPTKPTFGDQVMPDNNLIGELAAQYLLRHGHRRLAYLGSGSGSWWLKIRSSAFVQAAAEVGLEVDFIEAHDERELWAGGEGGIKVAQGLVDRLLALSPRPTGLFVAEDHLLPSLDTALWMRGMRMGKGKDFEVISCNNEQPHLSGLHDVPPTIDIRAESIGWRGVEQLLWRLNNPDVRDRVRTMVEPCLVEPGNINGQSLDGFDGFEAAGGN